MPSSLAPHASQPCRWGLSAVKKGGHPAPEMEARPTGSEFARGYLDKLAEQLKKTSKIHLGCRVVAISRGEVCAILPSAFLPLRTPSNPASSMLHWSARSQVLKTEEVHAAGEVGRDVATFNVVCCRRRAVSGEDDHDFMLHNFAAVIDCSGTYGNGNHLGVGGVPALGERRLRALADTPTRAWFDSLPDVCGRDKPSFMPSPGASGRRVVLIGGGYSAASTLLSLVELARAEEEITLHVEWLLRRAPGCEPYARLENDPLPARHSLVAAANALAAGEAGSLLPPNLTLHVRRGVVIDQCSSEPALECAGALRVTGRSCAPPPPVGSKRAIGEPCCRADGRTEFELIADVVISHVGFRPDTALTRELHVHTCYASEGPMKLAASLLSARVAAKKGGNAAAAGDCLAQAAPGPELMRTPEPQFFVCGAKSYGRNSAFLLTLGHAQVEAVVGILEKELAPQPGLA